MAWHPNDPAGPGGSGIDWQAGGPVAQTIDPALYWAEQSHADAIDAGEGRLSAAFELDDPQRGRELAAWLATEEGRATLQVAPVWLALLQGGATRFFTGRLRIAGLAAWPGLSWFRSIKVGFVGWQPEAADVAPGTPARAPLPHGEGAVVGLIDFGCCFAHPHVSRLVGERWSTRVLALWDQGAAPEPDSTLWSPCADFGHGRETDRGRLDELIAAACTAEGHVPLRDGLGARRVEQRCYAAAGLQAMVQGDLPAPHGLQVLDVAAGAGFALPPAFDRPGTPAADAASQADILFVQLPEPAVRDLSGGWLAVQLIDALRWLVDRAAGRPLVVNLSFGTFAGSHDGESLLERALDDAVGPRVEVVLAAGNIEHQDVHARARLAPGAQAQLDWNLPDGDGTQSFLELWYAAEDDTLRAAPPRVTLQPPGLPAGVLEGPGAVCCHRTGAAGEGPMAALVHVPGTRCGGRDGLVLVSTAPTMTPGRALPAWPVRAPHGRWRLTLENTGEVAMVVHAWVERDDPGSVPVPLAPQPRLVEVAGFLLDDDATLSGQCGARQVRVVGASRLHSTDRAWDNARGPGRLPGGRSGVDHLAPGSQQAPDGRDVGLPVAAAWGDAPPVYATGTSLAAPWVVRQLVNLGGTPGARLPRDGTRVGQVQPLSTPTAAA